MKTFFLSVMALIAAFFFAAWVDSWSAGISMLFILWMYVIVWGD